MRACGTAIFKNSATHKTHTEPRAVFSQGYMGGPWGYMGGPGGYMGGSKESRHDWSQEAWSTPNSGVSSILRYALTLLSVVGAEFAGG